MHRQKKAEPRVEDASSSPAARITPDPLREKPRQPAYVWRAGQKRRESVPRLAPGEAEALHRAEWAQRQAEQQHERARVEAALAEQQALVDAGLEPASPPPKTSLGGFIDQQF
jgi:hypothetical protein